MVILSLSQLKGIEEHMLNHCLWAEAEIIIDCRERAVYLQWRCVFNEKQHALSKKFRFIDIDLSRTDVLKLEAMNGSRQFTREVKAFHSNDSKPRKNFAPKTRSPYEISSGKK